jgi:predicted DNA binding CopG/RHH family protein
MVSIKLTKEEKDIIMADEKDLLKRKSNIKNLRQKYSQIAKNTLRKNKSITIRLAEKDLQKVKAKAIAEGMPYQTLITSIIHKDIY